MFIFRNESTKQKGIFQTRPEGHHSTPKPEYHLQLEKELRNSNHKAYS